MSFEKPNEDWLDAICIKRAISSIIARASNAPVIQRCDEHGAVAQLGERMTGSHEVRGSIPLGSTKTSNPGAVELHEQYESKSAGIRSLLRI